MLALSITDFMAGSLPGPRPIQMLVVVHVPAASPETACAPSALICFMVDGSTPYASLPYVACGMPPVFANCPALLFIRFKTFIRRKRNLESRIRTCRWSAALRTPAVLIILRSLAFLAIPISTPARLNTRSTPITPIPRSLPFLAIPIGSGVYPWVRGSAASAARPSSRSPRGSPGQVSVLRLMLLPDQV